MKDSCGNNVANPPILQCYTIDHFSINETVYDFCKDKNFSSSEGKKTQILLFIVTKVVPVVISDVGVYDVFFYKNYAPDFNKVLGASVISVIPAGTNSHFLNFLTFLTFSHFLQNR